MNAGESPQKLTCRDVKEVGRFPEGAKRLNWIWGGVKIGISDLRGEAPPMLLDVADAVDRSIWGDYCAPCLEEFAKS